MRTFDRMRDEIAETGACDPHGLIRTVEVSFIRAAALAALGRLGCAEGDFAAVERALRAPAWQVRVGAARAQAGATADLAAQAISRLSEALGDLHLDVRKVAVLSLTRWADEPAAREALRVALKDSDADMRAYARRALDEGLAHG